MVYKYVITQKVLESITDNDKIENKNKYADAYMNFENISIVCHYGKGTANYIIELCKHFSLDYFVINDWDFEETDLEISLVSNFKTLEDLKADDIYIKSDKKSMITTNWNLINNSGQDNIHFNVKKLENVIGYGSNDKNSIAIWDLINSGSFTFDEKLFPEKLELFLNVKSKTIESEQLIDLPF